MGRRRHGCASSNRQRNRRRLAASSSDRDKGQGIREHFGYCAAGATPTISWGSPSTATTRPTTSPPPNAAASVASAIATRRDPGRSPLLKSRPAIRRSPITSKYPSPTWLARTAPSSARRPDESSLMTTSLPPTKTGRFSAVAAASTPGIDFNRSITAR